MSCRPPAVLIDCSELELGRNLGQRQGRLDDHLDGMYIVHCTVSPCLLPFFQTSLCRSINRTMQVKICIVRFWIFFGYFSALFKDLHFLGRYLYLDIWSDPLIYYKMIILRYHEIFSGWQHHQPCRDTLVLSPWKKISWYCNIVKGQAHNETYFFSFSF